MSMFRVSITHISNVLFVHILIVNTIIYTAWNKMDCGLNQCESNLTKITWSVLRSQHKNCLW